MKRKTKIIVYTTCIIITLLILLGFTYGYFITKIKGNDNKKSIHIVSGDSSILYTDLSTTEINDLIEPGYTITKLFTIKNTGNVDAIYSIYLTDVVNNFERKQDVTYTLYRKVGNNTITESNLDSCEVIVKDKEYPSTKSVIKADEIISTSTLYYTYALKISYINHPTENQNVDQGKKFSGKVQIYATSSEDLTNPFSEGTLSYTILNNAITAKNSNDTTKTIYSEIPKTKPAAETSGENEKTLSVTPDDYGTSYYYRGSVTDNYVNFAGMCWKIVRIQGDGSVKLILEDYNTTCNSSIYTGNWTDGKTYKFGSYSNDTLLTDFVNYSGGLVDALKSFQTTKLSNYLDKLKVDDWCYDNSIGSKDNDNFNEIYGASKRISTDKSPSLVCSETKLNAFKDGTSMYVGTLTADEISFAGATSSTNYTHYLINSYVKDHPLYWWTLSPSDYYSYYAELSVFSVDDKGCLTTSYASDDGYNATMAGGSATNSSRPSISLKDGIEITGGDGTIDNPYTIKTS